VVDERQHVEEVATGSLTAAEVERGWVSFECDAHGFLVAMPPGGTTVWCSCGKRARMLRHGRLLSPDTLKPTGAKARALNETGNPFIHGCADCGADFRSKTLLARHRVGRGGSKRCLARAEMLAKSWRMDDKGRWRRLVPYAFGASPTTRVQTPERADSGTSEREVVLGHGGSRRRRSTAAAEVPS